MNKLQKTQLIVAFAFLLLISRLLWRYFAKGTGHWGIDLVVYLVFVGCSLMLLHETYHSVGSKVKPAKLIYTGFFYGIGVGLSTLFLVFVILISFNLNQTMMFLDVVGQLTAINDEMLVVCGELCVNIDGKADKIVNNNGLINQ